MFNHIGKTIIALAATFAVLLGVGAIIGGVVFLTSNRTFVLGIVVIFVGLLFAWLAYLFLAAFGELVESSTVAAEKLTLIEKHIYDYLSSNVAQAPSVAPKAPATSAPATPSASAAPQSDHLEYFRAQGLITEEEYQQALRLKQQ